MRNETKMKEASIREEKVLFVIPCLQHGGTNRVLEDLLNLLDGDKLNMSILCLRSPQEGEGYYYQVFSEKYNLYFQPYALEKMTWGRVMLAIHNRLRSHWGISFLVEFFYRLSARIIEKRITPDVVVAFEEGYATMMASFFKCRKIAWVHCDYQSYMNGNRSVLKKEAEFYNRYSNIVCVSKYTSGSFSKIFNGIRDRVIPIYNPINTLRIKKMSADHLQDSFFSTSAYKIVSVGRYAREKQFYKIPDIIKEIERLSHNQLKYEWYIIGSGYSVFIDETLRKIKEYSIEDKLFLLGAKDNPYPYIKAADLMVCTSSSEAYPTVINEAKVLGVPVVSNKFPSVKEILSGKEGRIADFEELPQIIMEYINKGKSLHTDCYGHYEEYNNDIRETIVKLFSNN